MRKSVDEVVMAVRAREGRTGYVKEEGGQGEGEGRRGQRRKEKQEERKVG
jgi:hypothetical protein